MIAATERVAMPGASSARPSAATKGIRSRSASAATQASARSPMPRLGTLRMRRRLTVSVGLEMHAQVGERVLDLAPLVEPRAADDLVGQADPDEHLLDGTGLRVGAVEHRDVPGAHPVLGAAVDLLGDERRLVVLVVGHVADDQLPVPESVQSFLGLRPSLRAMTEFAARQDASGSSGSSARAGSSGRSGSPPRTRGCCGSWRRGTRRSTGRSRPPRTARRGAPRSRPRPPEIPSPTSSLMSWYCAWFVSWYSSTRMCLNRRR